MAKLLLILTLLAGGAAHAELFGPSCGIISKQTRAELFGPRDLVILAATGSMGMTCENVKAVVSAAQAVNMAIWPALLVLKTPGVREELAAELAVMGLTFANPAVLGVTVLGAFGYVTVYFVLKASAEECEKARVQELIKREVEARLQVTYDKPIPVKK